MIRASLRTLVVLGAFCVPTVGRSQALPPFVTQGLDLLTQGRVDSAVQVWTSSWVAPEDLAKRAQLVDAFKQLPQIAGPMLGYEFIRAVEITPHLRRLYFLLRCERQPTYLLLVVYQPRNDWVMTTVNWHTNADHVLPENLFGLEHPKQ